MTEPVILVVGATGTVGSEVVKQLVEAGPKVRALVRDPAKASMPGQGAEIALGNLARPETLAAAFAGAHAVLVLAPPGPELEQLERNAFEAARSAGARHIVYLSNFGSGQFQGPIWQWHGASERRLRELGPAWTILRPARFMTDTPFPWSWSRERRLVREATGNGRITMIDPRDIAAVAVKALTTEGHEGATYELTAADALTGAEIVEAIAAVTGEAVTFEDIPEDVLRAEMTALGMPDFLVQIVLHYCATVREGRWYNNHRG